jgi:hypothetical protein
MEDHDQEHGGGPQSVQRRDRADGPALGPEQRPRDTETHLPAAGGKRLGNFRAHGSDATFIWTAKLWADRRIKAGHAAT